MVSSANGSGREGLRIAWFVHPKRMGGVESFLLRLARHLAPERVQVAVLFHVDGPVARVFARSGLDVHVCRDDGFEQGFAELVRLLSHLRVDAVQTNLYSPLAAVAAGSLALPHLWRVGGHPEVALRRFTPDERQAQLELMALQSCGIVCNSRYVSAAFDGIAGPDPVVIRNGMPRGQAGHRGRGAPKDPEAPPRVCMLAHFDPQKRHEDLIRAAPFVLQREPRTRFLFFGSTFDEPSLVEYRLELESLARSLGLEGSVQFGETDQAESELDRSTVSVLPSLGESSSNAILESFAAGTPVIAADSAGNSEMIDCGIDGLLVPPHAPQELGEAILSVVRNRTLAGALAEGGLRRLRDVYDIELCARRYEAFYDDHLRRNVP